MDDLISRQKAIDAIHCDITVIGKENAETVARTIGEFVDRIKALPTAQPEIIYCKDCRNFHVEQNGEMWCGISKGHGIDKDFFCADAERRTDD